MKKWLALAMVWMMLFSFACAEDAVQITEVVTQIGENAVRYPQLQGMADEAVQKKINDDLVVSSGVSSHLVTLITLGQNPWGLQVDHRSALLDGKIFSTVISAKGKIGTQRDAHQYTALCYDLSTGRKLTLEDVFADADAAVEKMEQIAVESLLDELSGYTEYSDITPLPRDAFTLDESGITFWYPADQFSLLSGSAGAVQFWYEELEGLWKKEKPDTLSDEERKALIAQSVAEGAAPDVPARMGQSIGEIADVYRLLRTPDEFPGGRYCVMEDAAFRNILLITDALQNDLAHSKVEGIQLKRGALHGLVIGRTMQPEWREVLGEPLETVAVTESMAYDYRLPEGEYDVYHFGSHELRLHADEEGMLCAIQLCNQ